MVLYREESQCLISQGTTHSFSVSACLLLLLSLYLCKSMLHFFTMQCAMLTWMSLSVLSDIELTKNLPFFILHHHCVLSVPRLLSSQKWELLFITHQWNVLVQRPMMKIAYIQLQWRRWCSEQKFLTGKVFLCDPCRYSHLSIMVSAVLLQPV